MNDCMEASKRDNTWVFVRKDIVADAIALLKEPEAVVRCPGCVYKNTCISTTNRVEPDGFCKWGETVTNIYG